MYNELYKNKDFEEKKKRCNFVDLNQHKACNT